MNTRSSILLVVLLACLFCEAAMADGDAGKTVAPLLAQEPMSVSTALAVTLGLGLVLATIIGVAWGLRRFGGFHDVLKGQLRVVGGISVGTRERAVVVQVGDKQILLGVAPGRVALLHVLDSPLEPQERSSRSVLATDFAKRLHDVLNSKKESQ